MSIAELKDEIHRAVDNLPERDLIELLDLLNKKQQMDQASLDAHVNAIVAENKGLLYRLAQ